MRDSMDKALSTQILKYEPKTRDPRTVRHETPKLKEVLKEKPVPFHIAIRPPSALSRKEIM
jgi:hypothetical protein